MSGNPHAEMAAERTAALCDQFGFSRSGDEASAIEAAMLGAIDEAMNPANEEAQTEPGEDEETPETPGTSAGQDQVNTDGGSSAGQDQQ